jgi:hypothetical protein
MTGSEMTDFIKQQKGEIDALLILSQQLRGSNDKSSLTLYYKSLLNLVEKQLSFYGRLALIGSTECVMEMREMTDFFERNMGKTSSVSTQQYLNTVRKEILWHLTRLTASKWH